MTEKSQQEHHLEIKRQKSLRNCEKLKEAKSIMNEKITRRALEASIKVDASSWPNTLPIKRYGFLLKK